MAGATGFLRRIAIAPIEVAIRCIEWLLGPRPLAVGFFALLVWPGAFHVLRPPLSHDVSGFELPLFGEPNKILAEGENPLETLRWQWISPGMLLAALATLSIALVLIRVGWFGIGAGIMLAGWVVCYASVGINQPLIVQQMDRELDLHSALTVLIAGTAEPEIDIVAPPRVDPEIIKRLPGRLLRGLDYVPMGQWTFFAVSALGVVVGTCGMISRRLAFVGLWFMAGIVASGVTCGIRLESAWHRQRAIVAEAKGRLLDAKDTLESSIKLLPALSNLKEIWTLRGLIDFQRDADTPEARFFIGTRWALNGRMEAALAEFRNIQGDATYYGTVPRWHADTIGALALKRYQQGDVGGAEELYRRAVLMDTSLPQRKLALAVLLSHRSTRQPAAIASIVNSLLPRIADRALQASLLAMLGDCYFESGDFAEARNHYQRSLTTYSLPKIINYRALRGLVGI